MKVRTKVAVALLWAGSLAMAGVIAQAQQKTLPTITMQQQKIQAAAPEILAGPEIGFRVDRYRGDTPIGELVVKKDGKWVPVEFDAKMKMVR